jgi:hypothetical protein
VLVSTVIVAVIMTVTVVAMASMGSVVTMPITTVVESTEPR